MMNASFRGGATSPEELWRQVEPFAASIPGAATWRSEHGGGASPGLPDAADLPVGPVFIDWPHDDVSLSILPASRLVPEDSVRAMNIPWGRPLQALRDAVVERVRSGNLDVGIANYNLGNIASPRPPIFFRAGAVSIRVTSRKEILDNYPSIGLFLDAWDGHEAVGEQVVVWIGLECTTPEAFIQRLWKAQWHLARNALPGKCRYGRLPENELHPAERDQFFAGRDTMAHTETTDGLCIFSCFVGDDEHVAPREYWMLRDILKKGVGPGGQPVSEVRVVFPDEGMARRECRPILDVGARVMFVDRTFTAQFLGG